MAINSTMLVLTAAAAESAGASNNKALPLALVASMMRGPMAFVILMLAVTGIKKTSASSSNSAAALTAAPGSSPPLPSTPTLTAAVTTVNSNPAVSLTWTAVPSASSYSVVRMSTAVDSDTEQVGSVTALTLVDDGDDDGVDSGTYFYIVTAFDSKGNFIASSTPATVTIP
jgi:hypothetical protein